MKLRFLVGSILLLVGFITYQIGFAMSLKSERLIRETLATAISTLPVDTTVLSNSILTESLGGVIGFIGLLLCVSSIVRVND